MAFRSAPMRYCPDGSKSWGEKKALEVGDFFYEACVDAEADAYLLYIYMILPAQDGGGSACSIPIGINKPAEEPSWKWDGNIERPTLTPSVFQAPRSPESRHHWHGFITAGVMVGC